MDDSVIDVIDIHRLLFEPYPRHGKVTMGSCNDLPARDPSWLLHRQSRSSLREGASFRLGEVRPVLVPKGRSVIAEMESCSRESWLVHEFVYRWNPNSHHGAEFFFIEKDVEA